MRIYHLFRDAPFDADHIELMSAAFEDVSQQLALDAQMRARRPADCISCVDGIVAPDAASISPKRIDFVARSNQSGSTALR